MIRVPSFQLPWQHSIVDLGTLGGPTSGIAINAFGTVTGFSYLSTADPHHAGVHAVRYADAAGMIDVGVLPPGNVSCGNGINSAGTICGHSFVAESGTAPHAFIANSALALTDLGTGDDVSVAFDINDHGVVTGEATSGVSDFRACIWTSGVIRDIGTLGGSRSVGRSINDSGQVAGESAIDKPNETRAFRFTEGQGMISLGTLGGVNSSAYGINNGGQVVGESDTGPILQLRSRFTDFSLFGTRDAFLWTEGIGMRDLGHLGGGTSRATAINNRGLVVGSSTLSNGGVHAFSWTHEKGMIDLNSLLPLFSGWVLIEANGVNDSGQITGFGLHNGAQRAFRLDPPRIVIKSEAGATARGAAKPMPVPQPAQPIAATRTPSPPPQPASPEERIGVVTHYYSHLSVATLRLEPGTTLRVGDMIHIRGHTTDFSQRVESLEVNHAPATEVAPNRDFGLKVVGHAREHDVVYKVRP